MKIWIIFAIMIGFFIGVTLGIWTFASYSAGQYEMYTLSIYACHDGCSIATKDSNGFLTNETWDCWDKCNDYIKEVLGDIEEKKE